MFAELAAENYLHGSSKWPVERFAQRLAYYQGELIALHPFYELNGRITRLYFDLIAIANEQHLHQNAARHESTGAKTWSTSKAIHGLEKQLWLYPA